MIPSFDDFFRSVWDYEPYPWQSRLARRVASDGWPDVLDLPTGSGKTAVLDIALHHLVVDGGKRAPRRIMLVVDRRVIVDQVAERAERIRTVIEAGKSSAARGMREALREMVGVEAPLLTSPVLRGGTIRDDSWARYPHVPVLAATTVDQVGSRLLFRGYGQSRSMQPIHAGLVGCDTLLLLDEVHLARPFAEALAQLDHLRGSEGEVPRRTGVVQMSATPGAAHAGSDRFELAGADRGHPRLSRVIEAPKPTELVEVKVPARAEEADKRATIATRSADLAREMVGEGRRAVAVVVNRVDTARRVWAELSEEAAFDCELITGRMRPLDQSDAVARISQRVAAGRDPEGEDGGRALVVVATQCIEAGADYDFDGLITECASLDALRQRFGRLDRRGEVPDRIGSKARGVVLARSDIASTPAPVYGPALNATWSWLLDLNESIDLDFGTAHLEPHLAALSEGKMAGLLAESREAPVLLPVYLEQWNQTRPRPHADPDVSLFLHGIPRENEKIAAEVQIVWRADLAKDDFSRAADDAAIERCLIERLAGVPPASLEALSLPIWAVRRWLSDNAAEAGIDELSDTEGVAGASNGAASATVLLWRGQLDSRVVKVDQVKPGSTVVVPSSWGGLASHGTFDPAATRDVADLGDVAHLRQRGRAVLRMDPQVWPSLEEALDPIMALDADPTVDLRSAIRDFLTSLGDAETSVGTTQLREVLDRLGADPLVLETERCGEDNDTLSRALLERHPDRGSPDSGMGARVGSGDLEDEEDTSFSGVGAGLEGHLEGMASLARDFAQRLGLSEPLVATLWWAGRLHDVGKIDPRFQLMLYGGDPVAARFAQPLAKSPVPWQDARTRRRARRLAGYPGGQRHELVSLVMIEENAGLREVVEADGADWDLLLHLVASHHGWARPLAPPVSLDDDESDQVSWAVDRIELEGSTAHDQSAVTSGLARRFYRLGRRYGWHELAYLEAILRLADHRRSEREVEG